MSIVGEKPAEHESDARQRLLQAARDEFVQSGYKGASTRAIAERAGVNEVTLFRHFGNKLGIMNMAVLNAIEQLRVPKDIDHYLKLPLREGLTKLIDDYMKQLDTISDLFILGMAESYSHPELADRLKNLMLELRKIFTDFFEKSAAQNKLRQVDFQVVAHIVLSSFNTISVMRRRCGQDITKHCCDPDITKHLTDEKIQKHLVDMIVSTFAV